MQVQERIVLHVAATRKFLHDGAHELRCIAATARKDILGGRFGTDKVRMGVEYGVCRIDSRNHRAESLALVHAGHVERSFTPRGTTSAGMAQHKDEPNT